MNQVERRIDVRRTTTALGGCLLAFGLVLGAAGVAGAAGGTGGLPSPSSDNAAPVIPAGVPVARVQAWLTRALTVRLSALTAGSVAIAAARNLTAPDRTALDTIISTDQSGLTALSTTLAGETTLAELRQTAVAMVLDYRVFSLVAPQVRAVILADRELATAAALTALEPSIETAITTEQRNARRTAVAQRIYEKLVAVLSGIGSSLGGTSASLLALTPLNVASAPATFAAATSALSTAGSQLVSARIDVREIVAILGGA